MSDILRVALTQWDITELPGHSKNNPEIMKYFDIINKDWVKNDETAWCSAFANWVCITAGKKSSGELNARSWLTIGERVYTPQIGDICVLWRISPKSWQGHVGFVIKVTPYQVYLLGGNQNNKVCIMPYTIGRVLQYRRV